MSPLLDGIRFEIRVHAARLTGGAQQRQERVRHRHEHEQPVATVGSFDVGNLTLNAQGDPNAIFVFQMASTLTTTSGLGIVLSGGASASNVFWQVGTSATIGSTSDFQGTILASESISFGTSATLSGRALASIAGVTMLSNTVVAP